MEIYGTDCGPKCFRCRGTIWAYELSSRFEAFTAKCAGCHAVEGLIQLAPYKREEVTANTLRLLHTRFIEPRGVK